MIQPPNPADLLRSFLNESWQVLAGLEEATEGLGSGERGRAFEMLRLLTHRLKGSAALYGLNNISSIAATMERAVRDGDGDPEDSLESLRRFFGDATGTLHKLFSSVDRTGVETDEDFADLVEAHSRFFIGEIAGAGTGDGRDPELVELGRFGRDHPDVLEYFAPEVEEHLDGMDRVLEMVRATGPTEDAVAVLFRRVHTLKGAAYTVECPVIGNRAHQLEELLVKLRDGEREVDAEALDALAAGAARLRQMLEAATRAEAEPEPAFVPAAQLTGDAALRAALFQERLASPPGPPRMKAGEAGRRTIRVGLGRIDHLLNLVGELVLGRSRLDRNLEALGRLEDLLGDTHDRMAEETSRFETKYLNPKPKAGASAGPGQGGALGGALRQPLEETFAELELDRYDDFSILARRVGEIRSDLAEVGKELSGLRQALGSDAGRLQQLARDLRTHISRTRMVPIGQLFGRFSRVVGNEAALAGKQVSLETRGESVEIDNLIVERISDPVMHMIRNAVTHGIEPPADRRRQGKPEEGTITLSAQTQGQFILLEVSDDGAGLDPERLRQRAVEQGLGEAEEIADLDDTQALELIFLPGLSTLGVTTPTAGRGVGMDVVRSNLARISGEIEIESQIGVGTTFRLRLPLTLAVSEALLLRVAGQVFAIPTTAVRTMVYFQPEQVTLEDGGEWLEIEGTPVELRRLDRTLGLGADTAGEKSAILTHAAGRPYALAADELLGIEEVVIKPLGGYLDGVAHFGGATISTDGRLVLLLDPAGLAFAAPARAQAPPTVSTSLVMSPLSRGSVLLADDSISVRRVLGDALRDAGFQVATAIDGVEALEKIRESRIDVIVTDLEMPRLNGYELIDEVRRRRETRDIPVFVITTRVGTKHLQMAERLGATEYLPKPIDRDDLVRRVEAAARRTQADEVREVGER